MRSTAGSGTSAPVRPSASEIRSPQPQSSVTTASRGRAIQSSRGDSPTAASIARAASTASGRGSFFWNFGLRACSTAVASTPSRSASQRVNPFTADSARASDRADTPRPRSCAIQARRSAVPTFSTGPRPAGPPKCPVRNAR